ncbi:MAG: hypothetical protein UW03_C0003G0046 [Candidatus Peregrinibacteria bacterium GW2011_GWA2_43_8]|nr:MAG: hypothetical protein UW03_C0003G0046 [Candidatus Peregrinibacteria bacterium GW2011_GWA2_43_8]
MDSPGQQGGICEGLDETQIETLRGLLKAVIFQGIDPQRIRELLLDTNNALRITVSPGVELVDPVSDFLNGGLVVVVSDNFSIRTELGIIPVGANMHIGERVALGISQERATQVTVAANGEIIAIPNTLAELGFTLAELNQIGLNVLRNPQLRTINAVAVETDGLRPGVSEGVDPGSNLMEYFQNLLPGEEFEPLELTRGVLPEKPGHLLVITGPIGNPIRVNDKLTRQLVASIRPPIVVHETIAVGGESTAILIGSYGNSGFYIPLTENVPTSRTVEQQARLIRIALVTGDVKLTDQSAAIGDAQMG